MNETRDSSEVIFKKYDDLIKEQQLQIETFLSEHTVLKREITKLINENDDLRAMVDKDFHKRIELEISEKFDDVLESEKVKNLKSQLQISWNERKNIAELYETSQQLIAKLEQELRNPSQDHTSQYSDPVVSVLKSKIEEINLQLKLEKNLREEQETQRLKYQTEEARLRMQLVEMTETFHTLEKEKLKREESCIRLEQECTVLKATVDFITQSRDELETALHKNKECATILEARNREAVAKVEEAVEVAERAISERELVLAREAILRTEVLRLTQNMDEITKASAAKLSSNISEITNKYEERISCLSRNQDELETELKLKTESFNELLEECRRVERSMEKQKRRAEKKELAESSAFLLESQLGATEQSLNEAQKTITEAVLQNEKLQAALEVAQQREGQFRSLVEDMKRKLDKCRCAQLHVKFKKLKEVRASQVVELKRQVDNQLNLNEKWQREAERLSELLNAEIRCEDKLRARNKILTAKLRQALRFKIQSPSTKEGCSIKEGYISC